MCVYHAVILGLGCTCAERLFSRSTNRPGQAICLWQMSHVVFLPLHTAPPSQPCSHMLQPTTSRPVLGVRLPRGLASGNDARHRELVFAQLLLIPLPSPRTAPSVCRDRPTEPVSLHDGSSSKKAREGASCDAAPPASCPRCCRTGELHGTASSMRRSGPPRRR
jgi:hypothetical protein